MTVNNVLIAGGGTAGWMTALYLAKTIGAIGNDALKISLVESSDIPTVGVGEGTFPSIKTTLNTMGIDESEFIRECDATFKQGIRFNNWAKNPTEEPDGFYQHLFDNSHQMQGRYCMSPYWVQGLNGNVAYSESVSLQHLNCEKHLGPKVSGDRQFFGGFQYAYHLDAGKLAEFLKSKAIQAGVSHIIGTIQSVEQSETGYIESVTLTDSNKISADLFVDCTGFAGLLIGKTLGEPVKSIGDKLFVDRTLTVQMPYESEDSPIPSSTLTTANEAGWTWNIGLRKRRGIGYVFSSAHSSEDRAAEVLQSYTGLTGAADFRLIKMKTGYRKKAWVKNCVAVGLSGGFMEPLEATGIVFIEAAIWLLSQYFPRAGEMESISRHFNRSLETRYENAISFLKMHYCLSQRTDNAFWEDNRLPETIPDDLKEKLQIWKYQLPHLYDFKQGHETFGADSYRYVLLGMGHKPDLESSLSAYPHNDMAKRHFKMIAQASAEATSQMISHRSLIEGIHSKSVVFS